jgi:hypothetical protein
MGFFKSVRQLEKQAKEIDKTWDPGAQMKNASQRMAAATQMMAQQTEAANISATGTPAAATVVALREGFGEINFQPIVEVDLTILPSGLPPYPVTVKQAMPIQQMAMMRPGTNLSVKVDPNNPATVWIDPTSMTSA